jgi:CBS domain-containing protein
MELSDMICPDCGHDNIEGMDRCENCMKPLRDLDIPRPGATGGLVRSVMEDDLKQLLESATLTVGPDTAASEVVRRMKESTISCALIVDGESLAGVFTEHDVLCKLAGEGQQEKLKAPISEFMTEHPEVLKETDSVASALNKMAVGRYRNVPVQKEDGSYALMSIGHVLKYIAQEDW